MDLKNKETGSHKGLILPRVALQNLNELTMGTNVIADVDESWEKHVGLVVYNVNTIETATNRVCPGIHVWDGKSWIPSIPYANILHQKLRTSLIRNFKYLESDPINPNFDVSLWPVDKQADALSGKYKLGHSTSNNTDDLVDVRDGESNIYHTSRFYVGYKTMKSTYDIQESYDCVASATPTWVTVNVEEENSSVFSDGVWTTQSLRATKFPDGTSITPSAFGTVPTTEEPHIMYPGNSAANVAEYGVLYNWYSVINVGTGTGQTPDPGVSANQGGDSDDVHVQGICPSGWHVSNAQEWVDLFNGIANNISLFSSITTNTGPVVPYPLVEAYINPSLRPAMLAKWNSNASDKGGFYSTYSGRGTTNTFGKLSYYWSASSGANPSINNSAYMYYLPGDSGFNGIRGSISSRSGFYTVRCQKDTL